MLHAMPEHHLMEDLSSLHAHKAVIHLRLPEGLQWLDLSVPIHLIAIERRRGHWPLIRFRRRSLSWSRRGIGYIAF
jgi:hypothetical protein